MPCPDALRQKPDESLEILEHLSGGVALDGDVAFDVDQLRTVSGEHHSVVVDGIGARAHRQTEGIPRLEALLGRSQKVLPSPGVGEFLIRRSYRVHLLYVEPDIFLEP